MKLAKYSTKRPPPSTVRVALPQSLVDSRRSKRLLWFDKLTNRLSKYSNHRPLVSILCRSPPESFYEQIKDISDTGAGEKPCTEGKISEDVMALKTPDDVKEYLSKYLSNDNLSKDDLLKKLSLRACLVSFARYSV
jgi:hypothetical protein